MYKDQQKLIQEMKKSIKKLYEFGRLASHGGESFLKEQQVFKKGWTKLKYLINHKLISASQSVLKLKEEVVKMH